ncbi:MAG: VWA domain-containing protein [Rhizobiaceae bacterium]
MRFLAQALVSLVFICLAATAQAADRAIIVLDASGSMWGQIDGKPKLEIARQTLRRVLQTAPADMELGLMAYGHREKGSCEDIELVVPPASGTANAITSAADAMKFLGKTPLSAAVKKAAEDLKYTEDKATVILITDGLETCNADPCALGKELEQGGVDFTAHVVGFGLTAEEGKKVACLAENTGGRYIQASDETALEEALKVTVAPSVPAAPAPEPAPQPEPAKVEFNIVPEVVIFEGGQALQDDGQSFEVYKADATGAKGEHVTTVYNAWRGALEPGEYIIVAGFGEAKVVQKVTVEADKTATPRFNLNAGTLVLRPHPNEGAEIDRYAQVIVDFPGDGESASNYGETKIVVPAGEQKITVKLGGGEVSEVIQLAAGQTVEKDIVVGVGHLTINAFYAAGGDKVDSSNLFIKIVRAEKQIDGSRDEVGYNYGPGQKFDLPAGDYVAIVEMDQASVEVPVRIAVGETRNIDAALNAGVLSVSAPGAKFIEVLAAKKDLQGNRKQFGYNWGDMHQTTLTAGDYVVVADRETNGGKKEMPVTVKAGERVEIVIPE